MNFYHMHLLDLRVLPTLNLVELDVQSEADAQSGIIGGTDWYDEDARDSLENARGYSLGIPFAGCTWYKNMLSISSLVNILVGTE